MKYSTAMGLGGAAGLLIANKIGSAISDKNMKSSLLDNGYRADFVEELMASGKIDASNFEQSVVAAASRKMYQGLFKVYGEPVADFYMAKHQKSQVMGVTYDYDAELTKAISEMTGATVEAPYTALLLQLVFDEQKLVARNAATKEAASKAAAEKNRWVPTASGEGKAEFEKWAVLNIKPVSFGKGKTDGLFASKGFVFDGVKYETEKEAVQAKVTAVSAARTPAAVEFARTELQKIMDSGSASKNQTAVQEYKDILAG